MLLAVGGFWVSDHSAWLVGAASEVIRRWCKQAKKIKAGSIYVRAVSSAPKPLTAGD
jgi:hypothetical protein